MFRSSFSLLDCLLTLLLRWLLPDVLGSSILDVRTRLTRSVGRDLLNDDLGRGDTWSEVQCTWHSLPNSGRVLYKPVEFSTSLTTGRGTKFLFVHFRFGPGSRDSERGAVGRDRVTGDLSRVRDDSGTTTSVPSSSGGVTVPSKE